MVVVQLPKLRCIILAIEISNPSKLGDSEELSLRCTGYPSLPDERLEWAFKDFAKEPAYVFDGIAQSSFTLAGKEVVIPLHFVLILRLVYDVVIIDMPLCRLIIFLHFFTKNATNLRVDVRF